MKNIYNVVIGKMYSARDLGYYYQANKFQSIPSNIISTSIGGVSYPVLAKLNDQRGRQLLYFRKIVRITAFLIFPVMIVSFALAEEFVSILLTDKWLPSVPYFKILVAYAILAPFHILNINFLIVRGYSKLSFKLELFRNGLYILFLILFSSSIELILITFSLATFIGYLADLVCVQAKTSYKVLQQIKDILPYLIISVAVYFIIKAIKLLGLGLYTTIALQLFTSLVFYVGILKILGSKILTDVISLFRNKL